MSFYLITSINGVGVLIDDQPAVGTMPYNVPYGASCSLRVWVSVRHDAPQPDVLTLHTNVRRANGSIAFSDDRDTPLLDPDSSYEVDGIGPFTVDGYGSWTVDLSIDSLIDGDQVDVLAGIGIMDVPQPAGIDLSSMMSMMVVVMMMSMMMSMMSDI